MPELPTANCPANHSRDFTMTSDQANLVRSTWAVLKPRVDDVIATFYVHLFELEPEAAAMFAHVDMATQRKKFTAMFELLIRLLDDPADIVVETIPSARRHAAYGVSAHHLDAGHEALLRALADELGARFTPEVRQAYAKLYDLAAAVMRRAAARAHRAPATA